MARIEHTRNIDGKSVRFGVDTAVKELDVPDVVDADEYIQALAFEFSDVVGEDYPLDACIYDEDGTRQLNLAPGWSIPVADRARLRRISSKGNH